jgi:hypothetical protein
MKPATLWLPLFAILLCALVVIAGSPDPWTAGVGVYHSGASADAYTSPGG